MNLDQSTEKGYIHFCHKAEEPFFHIAKIVSSTNKALQINLETINKPIWIPKKALKPMHEIFVLKTWFRNLIIKDNKKYQLTALGIID